MKAYLKTMATAFIAVMCIFAFVACEVLFYCIVLAVFGAWMAWAAVVVSAVLSVYIGWWVLE